MKEVSSEEEVLLSQEPENPCLIQRLIPTGVKFVPRGVSTSKMTLKKIGIFPGKAEILGGFCCLGIVVQPWPCINQERKSFQIHLSRWGFWDLPMLWCPLVPRKAVARAPSAGMDYPRIQQLIFPSRVGKIQDFSPRKPFHALKGVVFPSSQILFWI